MRCYQHDRHVAIDGSHQQGHLVRTALRANCANAATVSSQGFTNAQLRSHLATLLGIDLEHYGAGRMRYDLRRLRLHGPIHRIAKTNRFQLTAQGLKVATFFSRTYARLLPIGPAEIIDALAANRSPLRSVFSRLNRAIN